MSSPTARTLAAYRGMGFTVHVTEKWNPHAKVRQDLFGIIDLLAISRNHHPSESGIIGIQACAGASHAARKKKMIAAPHTRTWLEAGGFLRIVSWSKQGKAGKRKVWVRRVENITLADLDGAK